MKERLKIILKNILTTLFFSILMLSLGICIGLIYDYLFSQLTVYEILNETTRAVRDKVEAQRARSDTELSRLTKIAMIRLLELNRLELIYFIKFHDPALFDILLTIAHAPPNDFVARILYPDEIYLAFLKSVHAYSTLFKDILGAPIVEATLRLATKNLNWIDFLEFMRITNSGEYDLLYPVMQTLEGSEAMIDYLMTKDPRIILVFTDVLEQYFAHINHPTELKDYFFQAADEIVNAKIEREAV